MKFKYSSSWTTSLLDDVTDRGSGHTPSQSSPEYWNGQIKWVSLADSSKLDNLFISNTDKTISELGIKNSSAVKHPAGTVILSRDAGVGKSAILKEEMAVSQHFIVWKCSSKNIIYNIYLYYWLQMMKHEFERMAVGSTIKTIGLPYFKKLEITYPPLLEQCRIAEVLGVWDESIDLLERLIGKTRSRKQGLMQQLLTGKKRFKEFEGSEWKTVRLRDISTINYGKSPKNIFSDDGEFPVYGTGGITGYTSTNIYDGESVIIGRKGTIDKVRYVIGKFWAIDTTYYLECKETAKVKWVYYFLSSANLAELNEASGVPSLNRDTLYAIKFKIPSLLEQEKIAAVLSAADEEISTLEKQLAAYKQQKLGLMQQLLTGKIRVGTI